MHETPDWNTARGGVWGESNPTNIEFPVFRGHTAITLITQKTLADAIFSLCLSTVGCEFLRFNQSQCFPRELGKQWD